MLCYVSGRGRPRMFSRDGKIRGLAKKVPQRVQGYSPGGGLGILAPRSRRQVVKIMHK